MLELQPHESTFALLADLMVTSARGTWQPLLLPDPEGEHTHRPVGMDTHVQENSLLPPTRLAGGAKPTHEIKLAAAAELQLCGARRAEPICFSWAAGARAGAWLPRGLCQRTGARMFLLSVSGLLGTPQLRKLHPDVANYSSEDKRPQKRPFCICCPFW